MGLGPSKEKIKKILEKSCNENKNLSEQTKLKIEYCKSLSVSETAMNGDSSFSSQNDSMDSDSSRSLGETSSYIDVTNVEGQNITSRSSAVSRSKEFPYMLEIFSRNPNFIKLEDDAVLTPLPIDDEISSLSAILLNEKYYELLKNGVIIVDDIPVLKPTCLIPFKAKAWSDLKERKRNGEHVDSKNIKKHKNDVFRLAQLISGDTRQELGPEIEEDVNYPRLKSQACLAQV